MGKKATEFTEEQIQEMNKLFAEGKGIQKISKILNIPKGKLKKPLREFKRGNNKFLSNKEQKLKLNDEEFKKQLRLEFLNGKSIETLAVKFGISTYYLEMMYKDCNFNNEELKIITSNKSQKIYLNNFQKEEIKRLYIDGYGQIRISKILGLDQWIIRTRIKELGLKELNISSHKGFPEKKIFTNEEKLKIKELYVEGKGTPTISKMLGIGKAIINKILREFGFDLKRRRLGQNLPIERQCRDCNIIKNIDNFTQTYDKKRDLIKFNYRCKPCDRVYQNKIQKIRRENNPMYRIRDTIGRHIQLKLKSNNTSKNYTSSFDYLPYTIDELKRHIENLFTADYNLTPNGEVWMNFDNWGAYNPETWNDNDPTTWIWQLDHIIPHCTFNYDSMEHPDFIKCWSLDNLRPYSAKLNAIENDRGYRLSKNKLV